MAHTPYVKKVYANNAAPALSSANLNASENELEYLDLFSDTISKSFDKFNNVQFAQAYTTEADKIYLPVEPSKTYVAQIFDVESTASVTFRLRKLDQSNDSNITYSLTAGTDETKEFTTTANTYYVLIGGTGTGTKYKVNLYKKADEIAKKSDLTPINTSIATLENEADTLWEIENIIYAKPVTTTAEVDVPVEPSTEYKITFFDIASNGNIRLRPRKSDQSYIQNDDYTVTAGVKTTISYTTPSNAYYIRVGGTGTTTNYKIAIQEGSGGSGGTNCFIDVVKDAGIDNTGASDVKTQLQSLLNISNTTGFVSLYFPAGEYRIDSRLNYYKKTKLVFGKGAILKANYKSDVILSNSDSASSGDNYNLGSLEIEGGTFKRIYTSSDTTEQRSIGLQCCQLEKLVVKDATFIDCCSGNHLIDISGCREVLITNNVFQGMHLPSVIRPTQEANYSYTDGQGNTIYTDLEMIQIDHGTGLGVGTNQNPTKNVKICDNTFLPNSSNTQSCIYRPVGIHSVSNLDEYRNIEVSGNKFIDAFGRVVSFSKARGIKVCDNLFKNDNETVISSIVKMSLNVAGNNDVENVIVRGNQVDYSVNTNGYKFFQVTSGGSSKAINGLVKWNDIGSFTNDFTYCENFEHD